jgi:uncharacterized protein YybS (DUF2232 family)
MNIGRENSIDMRREGWKLFALAFIFSVSAAFFPPLGVLVNSLTPFPLIIMTYYFGGRNGAIAVAGISVILAIVFGPEFALLFLVQYGLMALVVGEMARLGREWNQILFFGTAAVVLAGGGLIFLYASRSEGTILGNIQALVTDNIKESIQVYAKMGVDIKSQFPGEDEIATFVQMMVMVIPSILMVGSLMSVLVNSVLAGYMARRRYGENIFKEVDASLWKVSDRLVWVIIGGGILLLFFSNSIPYTIGLNALIVMGTLYLIQGISITIFFFRQWQMHLVLRGFIYGLMLVQPVVLLSVAIIGMADIWLDLRKVSVESDSD